MSNARWLTGDVFARLADIDDGSIDLAVFSPPFWKQRAYLPNDHPLKPFEIGQEDSPVEFIDVMLRITAAIKPKLARHGSIAVELADTMAGSGGAGGDYDPDGFREGQPKWKGSAHSRADGSHRQARNGRCMPRDKSHCMIPEAYRLALAYGINPLTGAPSPAGRWIVRNVVDWCRRNPTPGDDGDKFRRASSDIAIATLNPRRYWDGDAVRVPTTGNPGVGTGKRKGQGVANGDNRPDSMPFRKDDGTRPLYDWWEMSSDPYDGWTTTTRRVPCGPHDGGERTTSPDCPVHADLPGQLPRALRDARADARSRRNGHSDVRPELEQLPGFAPTGQPPAPTTADGSSDSPTPLCVPAATPHSTASSRTAPAPATTTPGTPFAQTSDRTGRTPASPEPADRPLDTPSTSDPDDDPAAAQRAEHGRSSRTDAPPSDSACTCSFFKVIEERTSHYAVWPPEVARRLILSMCPEKVCTTCGEPSRRIVERDGIGRNTRRSIAGLDGDPRTNGAVSSTDVPDHSTRRTIGWTDCGHNNWRRGHVLDPFGGSGTTGAVATGLGRDATLIDLDDRNLDLARARIGLFLDEPTAGDVA